MPRAANRTPLPGNSAFMLADWGDPPPVLARQPGGRLHGRATLGLAQAFPAELLVIPCGEPRGRSNDNDYVFRPGTDHVWLTGNTGASCVLIVDTTGGVAGAVLYLHAPSGRANDEFWRNDAQGDLWVARDRRCRRRRMRSASSAGPSPNCRRTSRARRPAQKPSECSRPSTSRSMRWCGRCAGPSSRRTSHSRRPSTSCA